MLELQWLILCIAVWSFLIFARLLIWWKGRKDARPGVHADPLFGEDPDSDAGG